MTIKLTETTIALKAQGITREVDATTFHEDALNAIFAYGVRRWFQDHINSVAKGHRDEGEDFDPADLFDARLDQAVSGEITMRNGTPADPLDPYRIAVVRDYMKTTKGADLKAAHDAIDSTEQKARREFLLAFAKREDNAAKIDKIAAERKAVDDAERKRAESLDLDFDAA